VIAVSLMKSRRSMSSRILSVAQPLRAAPEQA